MTVNYHTHSTWCDGRDTPEAMVKAAIEKGFTTLGFSSHSDMLRDEAAYIADIRALATRYADQLRILCGLEAELSSPVSVNHQASPPQSCCRTLAVSPTPYDYVIGSVHYVSANDGTLVCVDHTPQILAEGIRDHFAGDAVAFVKAYFSAIRDTLALDFDIVGHPDLVRKFNVKHPYFDETAPWYIDELTRTADAIASSGKYVEVNTGAISRGWIDDAYPSPLFRQLLCERGVKFILSSDAHAAASLDCAFDRFASQESFVTPF